MFRRSEGRTEGPTSPLGANFNLGAKLKTGLCLSLYWATTTEAASRLLSHTAVFNVQNNWYFITDSTARPTLNFETIVGGFAD
jgi:hypothetical protein